MSDGQKFNLFHNLFKMCMIVIGTLHLCYILLNFLLALLKNYKVLKNLSKKKK